MVAQSVRVRGSRHSRIERRGLPAEKVVGLMRTNLRLLGVEITLVAVGLVLVPASVQAYVGPGAGLSAIGSLLALAAAVVVTLVGFVWFPLKRFLRKVRGSVAGQRLHQPPSAGGR